MLNVENMTAPPSYAQVQSGLREFPKMSHQDLPPSYELATRKDRLEKCDRICQIKISPKLRLIQKKERQNS